MSPQLATLICILSIFYLFWIDRKNNKGFSKGIWIPFIWILFSKSDSLLEWLNIVPQRELASATAILKGNPFKSIVFSIIIIGGIIVLLKRRIDWHTIFLKNIWIWLYFIYGALSFFWSDYPFVSLKRWIKASGVVVMALVIVTETRPYMAVGVILKRLSFILLPFSVLFIKYYPEWGREYHMGEVMYRGIAAQKNGLGALCLISGIYFSWNILFGRRIENEPNQRLHYSIYLIMIPMTGWLFYMAKSATSLACFIFVLLLFMFGRHPLFVRNPLRIIPFCISAIVLLGLFELTFDFKDFIISMLGRRPDLTSRVPIWEYLLGMDSNHLLGTGYESFWLGERLIAIQQRWGTLIQAHNGYIEMYLNMGIIGVLFIFGWIVTGIKKVNSHFLNDYPAAILRLCFIAVVALYNYAESTFYGVSTLWMLFFVGIIQISWQKTPEKKLS